MNKLIHAGALLALAPLALLAAAPAHADSVLFASAPYSTAEDGTYGIFNDGTGLIAATFTLTQDSQITGVGGVFTQYDSDGSFFAAIIAAPADQADVTLDSLSGLALAHTTFTAPSDLSDFSTPLSLTLAAGVYELVIGSGQFGATGEGGFAYAQDSMGTGLLRSVDAGESWDALGDGVRLTVSGSPVPLPAAAWLLISGLGGLGGFARRRRAA